MKLKEVFKFYKPLKINGNIDVEITNISTHSAQIKSGGLFFAIKGEKSDGVNYIEAAISNGAVAVVSDREIEDVSVVSLLVEDINMALSKWSAAFYSFPAKDMEIAGVTGTNGKTTISNIIYSFFKDEGKAGLIGTSGYFYLDHEGSFGMTTPLAHQLHYLLNEMRDAGVGKISMEVSSHALALKRVEDLSFKSAIFTNLTQDHLDFHKTFENYYEAKLKLFDLIGEKKKGAAIINIDDQYGKKLVEDIDYPAVTYGIDNEADYQAVIINESIKGTKFLLKAPREETEVCIKLVGRFNVYNCLAAIAWAMEGGRSMVNVCKTISEVTPVPGRLEIVKKSEDDKKFVVVDYAHTPAALENVLITLRKIVKGNLICVFGCGGDRDREKRPLMGKIAGILADVVYLTSDNPRTEDPTDIILDIEVGIRDTAAEYHIVEEREEAIQKAISIATEDDCVLLAGKGDEEYQVIGEEKIPFSDRLEAYKYM
jgi:UDP-N-acetylmuramoyl-L-alanyl-D-glutamate--2,6-diaminopimelate ligase